MYENLDIQRMYDMSVVRADTTDMLDTIMLTICLIYMLDMRMVGVGPKRINEVCMIKLPL
jgi:hypothetical protein